jgi:hypothetical protein
MRKTRLLATTLLLCISQLGPQPTTASASQHVTLQAKFVPDTPDASTTIEFALHVNNNTPGQVPSPVTNIALDLPAGMGLATSTLGLADCQTTTLLNDGPTGCPANALVGIGTASAEVPIEGEQVIENATIHTYLGPPTDENEQLLFYVQASRPVYAQLVFPAEILPTQSPLYSGQLNTTIPLIPTWPNGPNIAVTNFNSTIGPRGLTYYTHTHGQIVPFTPKGIAVPNTCPHGGFPFTATFTFLDGTNSNTNTTVPCPKQNRTKPSTKYLTLTKSDGI